MRDRLHSMLDSLMWFSTLLIIIIIIIIKMHSGHLKAYTYSRSRGSLFGVVKVVDGHGHSLASGPTPARLWPYTVHHTDQHLSFPHSILSSTVSFLSTHSCSCPSHSPTARRTDRHTLFSNETEISHSVCAC